MDVQVTLWELLQAYHDGDQELVSEVLETLRRWNDGSSKGFMPKVVDAGSDVWQVSRTA